MDGRPRDVRLTDERGGQLTDKRSGCSDGCTGRRIEETVGLTETRGVLTDADGRRTVGRKDGRGGCNGRPRERNGGSGCKRKRAAAAAAASAACQRKREVVTARERASRQKEVLRRRKRGGVVMCRRVCGKGRQRERARAVAVADAERRVCRRTTPSSWAACRVLIRVQAASKGTAASWFLSLQYLGEAQGTSCRAGGIKSTLLAAYFCNAS